MVHRKIANALALHKPDDTITFSPLFPSFKLIKPLINEAISASFSPLPYHMMLCQSHFPTTVVYCLIDSNPLAYSQLIPPYLHCIINSHICFLHFHFSTTPCIYYPRYEYPTMLRCSIPVLKPISLSHHVSTVCF